MVQVNLKKMLLFVLFSLWTVCACANERIETIMVFGDSLSAAYGIDDKLGWVNLLQQRLDQSGYDINVVNASISGNTSGNGLHRIGKDLDLHSPDLLILELGGNDGLRGHPPQRLKQNLIKMIEICQARDIDVLLVAMQLPPSYGRRYTEAFADVYPSVAEATGVPLVKTFVDNIGTNVSLMQNDRIHPNEKGQPLLLDNVWPQLKMMLED